MNGRIVQASKRLRENRQKKNQTKSIGYNSNTTTLQNGFACKNINNNFEITDEVIIIEDDADENSEEEDEECEENINDFFVKNFPQFPHYASTKSSFSYTSFNQTSQSNAYCRQQSYANQFNTHTKMTNFAQINNFHQHNQVYMNNTQSINVLNYNSHISNKYNGSSNILYQPSCRQSIFANFPPDQRQSFNFQNRCFPSLDTNNCTKDPIFATSSKKRKRDADIIIKKYKKFSEKNKKFKSNLSFLNNDAKTSHDLNISKLNTQDHNFYHPSSLNSNRPRINNGITSQHINRDKSLNQSATSCHFSDNYSSDADTCKKETSFKDSTLSDKNKSSSIISKYRFENFQKNFYVNFKFVQY